MIFRPEHQKRCEGLLFLQAFIIIIILRDELPFWGSQHAPKLTIFCVTPDESEKCCILAFSRLFGQNCASAPPIEKPPALQVSDLYETRYTFYIIGRTEKPLGPMVANQQEVGHFRSKPPFCCFTHVVFERTPATDFIVCTWYMCSKGMCDEKLCEP